MAEEFYNIFVSPFFSLQNDNKKIDGIIYSVIIVANNNPQLKANDIGEIIFSYPPNP